MSEKEDINIFGDLGNTFFSLIPKDVLTRLSLFIGFPRNKTHEVMFMPFHGGRIPYSLQFRNKQDAQKFLNNCASLGMLEYCSVGTLPKKKKTCDSIEDAIIQMENETSPALGSASGGKGISYIGNILRRRMEEEEEESKLKKQKIESEIE